MVSPNKLAPVAQTTLKEPLAPCTVTRCRVRVRAVSEPRQPRPLLWAFCACPGFHEHAGVCLKNTSVLRYYDNIDASLAGYSTVALQLWLQLPFCIQIACTWYTQDLASIWIFPCTYRPAFSNCTTFVWDNLQPCQCQNLRMKKCWFTSEFHIELLIKWTSSLSFNYPPKPPFMSPYYSLKSAWNQVHLHPTRPLLPRPRREMGNFFAPAKHCEVTKMCNQSIYKSLYRWLLGNMDVNGRKRI